MIVDVVVNLFGADAAALVPFARAVDQSSVGALWVTDHFSGAVVGAPWSRDPFVALGAMASVTERVEVGILVANITNRHPAQLASAGNSLQSLAPGRFRLGLGSGAAPGSRFAVEHEAIGKVLFPTVEARREHLRHHIRAVRALWAGASSFHSPTVSFDDLVGVTDGSPPPTVIVGASAWPTIAVAIDEADGVNLRVTSALFDQLERIRTIAPRPFEVSVLIDRGTVGAADLHRLADLEVDRLIVTLTPPFDPSALPTLV
jgi:alkanesulfonate monooxygenase SsuD/methylene tetrahydromethanopterin reductase-like flavin-dependent oxidoreductase (luciferase family)